MNHTLKQLENLLDVTMIADQHPLRRRLQSLQKQTEVDEQQLASLAKKVSQSVERRQTRQQQLPVPNFELDLPVIERRDDIKKAITENQVVILSGETGSGKTTQLPKICLELGDRKSVV